jgi:branched-chain amino acid aminotransferase
MSPIDESIPSKTPGAAAAPTIRPGKCWIDGELVDWKDASIPLTDLMAVRGYAAFDALRTYGSVPFLLDKHLLRLERTCDFLGLRIPLDRANLAGAVLATVKAGKLPESSIRLYVTGGDAAGFVPEGRERLVILVDPPHSYPLRQYEQGVALATTTLGRTFPVVKPTNYLAGVWATMRARSEGFDEVVFVDRDLSLLEGTTFNVVAVRGRELISPADGVLAGVTIEHVLSLAAKAKFKVTREPISPQLLDQAEEVFMTSSVREVMPVVRIDDRQIGNGAPGPVTRLLHRLFCESAQTHSKMS